MRNNIKKSEKNLTFRGKVFFLLMAFLQLLMILSCFVGCAEKNETEEELIINDYSNIYYISESGNAFPVQFAYNGSIKQFDIVEIESTKGTSFTWEFIEEKGSDGNTLKIDDYYIYGVIFYLEGVDDFLWQSFTININESFEKTIELNIEVKILDSDNEEDDIRPISVPYISDFVDEAEWVFLPMNDIVISSINLISSLSVENEILFNSVKFTGDVAVEKLDMFYVKILFKDYKLNEQVDKVYLEIKYKKGGQDYVYISDYTVFGNQLDMLTNKILNR